MNKPRTPIIKAWKVFWPGLQFEYYSHNRSATVPRGKWLRAGRWPGFFAFLTKERADRWRDPGKIVRQVLISGIRCQGKLRAFVGNKRIETYPTCVCAQWMFVPAKRRKG